MMGLVATLCREPFHLSPSEVGRLSLVQIRGLSERAEGGGDGPDFGPTDRDLFWTWGRRHKLKEYQIKSLWDERQKAES